jgi:DNA processing protein
MEFIKSNEINAVYFQDEDYPERLKQCIDGTFYYSPPEISI